MTATDHALELVQIAAAAAVDKLALQVIAFDVSVQLAITDAFVLASASNERQVNAIVDEVEDKLREAGAKPIRREGQREGRWVLLDYGEIVVHVQHEDERQFYALERLWRDCPSIPVPQPGPPPPPRHDPHAGPAPPRPDGVERGATRAGAPRHRARRHRRGRRRGLRPRRSPRCARRRCGARTCAAPAHTADEVARVDGPHRAASTSACVSTTWGSAPG